MRVQDNTGRAVTVGTLVRCGDFTIGVRTGIVVCITDPDAYVDDETGLGTKVTPQVGVAYDIDSAKLMCEVQPYSVVHEGFEILNGGLDYTVSNTTDHSFYHPEMTDDEYLFITDDLEVVP